LATASVPAESSVNVSVSDNFSATDAPSAYTAQLCINAVDAMGISEATGQYLNPLAVSVSDQVTLTDLSSVSIPEPFTGGLYFMVKLGGGVVYLKGL
jgi:hypothetical protein